MIRHKKTAEVVRQLETTLHKIIGLLRYNKITPPAKDSSGDYCWTPQDIAAARQALRDIEAQRARRATAKAEVTREG
jgi:hypothetical protein